MNDTLAIPVQAVDVPPGTRPWWAVRRSLRTAFALVLALWTGLHFQQERVDRWVLTDLPVRDSIMLRFAGY